MIDLVTDQLDSALGAEIVQSFHLGVSDGFTQAVGAGRMTVDQLMVQEAVARFVVGKAEDLVYRPRRSGARSEVKFYVVFVLVEPGIEQKGFESHASTSKKKFVALIDSTTRRRDDFFVYEG